MYLVMISPSLPGSPGISSPPEVVQEVFLESVNIYGINEALTSLGLSFIPLVKFHPVSEAMLNLVITWAVAFLPAIKTDAKSRSVDNQVGGWVHSSFINSGPACQDVAGRQTFIDHII
jgi:hypothetical protein